VLQEGEGREETIGSCTEAAHGVAVSDAVAVLLGPSVGREDPAVGAICSACVEDLDAGADASAAWSSWVGCRA
jgi:hypothetical protein